MTGSLPAKGVAAVLGVPGAAMNLHQRRQPAAAGRLVQARQARRAVELVIDRIAHHELVRLACGLRLRLRRRRAGQRHPAKHAGAGLQQCAPAVACFHDVSRVLLVNPTVRTMMPDRQRAQGNRRALRYCCK